MMEDLELLTDVVAGYEGVDEVDTSLVNWTLRVEQLTRQEAETYLPKER